MHELGLMQGVIDSVKPVAIEAGATSIKTISLSIGKINGVVAESMQFAFDAMTDGEKLFEGATLEMNFIDGREFYIDSIKIESDD